MTKRLVRLLLVLAALMPLAGPIACSKKTGVAAAPAVVRGVRMVAVQARQVADTVDAIGTVQPAEQATLAAQVMGTVRSVAVREGDRVRAGQTLVTIDAAQLQSEAERARASAGAIEQQIAAAESDAALAASTLRRYEVLREKKSVSPQEFDEVQARSKAASARLDATRQQEKEARAAESSARTMQSYTRIRAPFDGVVTERKVDPGALAAPGSPLLTVEKASRLRLEVSVDESLLSAVRMGATVPVKIEAAGDAPLEGKVVQIVPAADPASRSFLVKIDLPSTAGLRSGMFGSAQFPRGSRVILLVPRSAVVTHGSLQGVYAVDANRIANLRYITLGAMRGSEAEVLSGLSAGDAIVEAPGGQELAGKRIEAQP